MNAKCLFIILLLLQGFFIIAQDITRYDLQSKVEEYVPLSSATQVLTDVETWLNTPVAFETDFDFENMVTTSNGFTSLFGVNDLAGNGVDTSIDSALIPLVRPLNVQFQNRAEIEGNQPSKILYKTEGKLGERIFKLEYANAGISVEQENLGSLDMFINVQLWIYEKSNCMEIRFGSSDLSKEADLFEGRPWISTGLLVTTLNDFSFEKFDYVVFAQGDPLNPTKFEGEEFWLGQPVVLPIEMTHYLYSFPPDGTVYTFCPEGIAPPTSTYELNNQVSWELYPNPVSEEMTIDIKESTEASYEIFTIDGRVLAKGKISEGQLKINVQSLSPGHYIIKTKTSNRVGVKRFFKI